MYSPEGRVPRQAAGRRASPDRAVTASAVGARPGWGAGLGSSQRAGRWNLLLPPSRQLWHWGLVPGGVLLRPRRWGSHGGLASIPCFELSEASRGPQSLWEV